MNDLPVLPTSSFFLRMSSRHERPQEWVQERCVFGIHLQSMDLNFSVIYTGDSLPCGVKPRQTPSTCPNRALLAVARMHLDLGVPRDDAASLAPGSLTLGVLATPGVLAPATLNVPASEWPGVDIASKVGSITWSFQGGTLSSMHAGVVSAGDSRLGSGVQVQGDAWKDGGPS